MPSDGPALQPSNKSDARVEMGANARRAWRLELRRGVELGVARLGQGFLEHPANLSLRAELSAGSCSPVDYWGELSRLLYRLIFLLRAEEQGLLHAPSSPAAAAARYAREQSLHRLRPRALGREADASADSLWEHLGSVFFGLAMGEPAFALPALGGIFALSQCPRLRYAKLHDRALLAALAAIAGWQDASALSRPSWGGLPTEELGSVYEALLAHAPQISENAREFCLVPSAAQLGNARRATGGYYTPERLVKAVLDGALEPALAAASTESSAFSADALGAIQLVDPACGSGYFLLAAGRRLARALAEVRAENETGERAEYRRALRHAVQHQLYGVDLNPMAVELCRLSLWLEMADPGASFSNLEAHIRVGNSLVGAPPDWLESGIPDAAWKPLAGDDRDTVVALRRRNRDARRDPPPRARPACAQSSADAWCAAFLWPKAPELAAAAPTEEVWRRCGASGPELSPLTHQHVAQLAREYRFFHWTLVFPEVFQRGGFDVVLGNPPWIAHAGRASQPLPVRLKHFFECNYESFADYPTTHGMFVSVAARLLRPGGHLGLVIPSSLSELGGYAPTRRAHDRNCEFLGELVDFGEGQFEGVTQPCMALISRRSAQGRSDAAPGEPWPMQRTDLDATARALIGRLGRHRLLPPELFGERGMQSDRQLAEHFSAAPAPHGRFTTPLREGTDVREFELRPPRLHVDAAGLGARLRSSGEFRAVRAVVRQTARYPIAALSDGMAFRNSLLAVFETPEHPVAALVALLNSALVRWFHYVRFRDARQPILPQLKISHLRALPEPPNWRAAREKLAPLGAGLSAHSGPVGAEQRRELDEVVSELYALTAAERALVNDWHARLGPTLRGRGERAVQLAPNA